MRTIGVSIPVPAPYDVRLQEARHAAGDPLAAAVPPHVTLMPPCDVRKVDLPAFVEFLERVAAEAEPFRMILRGTGTFRPVSPVVFVTVAQGISSCEALERAVRSGPVERELDFPYHPHVTIAQKVDETALDTAFTSLADYHAEFDVTAFDLYFHEDQVWRPVQTFSLGGPRG